MSFRTGEAVGAVVLVPPPAAAQDRGAEVRVTMGRDGIRGLVTMRGACDLDCVAPLIANIDRLLATDAGEIWIDLRDVTAMSTIVVAALVRARTRAVRFAVRVHLLPGSGEARRALERARALEGFMTRPALPEDLVPGPGLGTLPRRASAATLLARRVPVADEDGARLLIEDPDLASGLTIAVAVVAAEALRVEVLAAPRGAWAPPESARSGLGLLLLDGMLVRRVGCIQGAGAELLGPGDVLRGPDDPADDGAAWLSTSYRVLSTARFAVLDEHVVASLADYPPVLTALVHRAMDRAHALSVSMALAHYTRVDRRLLLLLWYIGQRFGRMGPRGIVLRLPVTHAVLADLIASRRPSVTIAFKQLERTGEIVREGADWILVGEPPTEVPAAPILV